MKESMSIGGVARRWIGALIAVGVLSLGAGIAQATDRCRLEPVWDLMLPFDTETESIEYDPTRDRYIVSADANNKTLLIHPDGYVLEDPYIDGVIEPHGTAVVGDLFYIAGTKFLTIFDLSISPPQQVDEIEIHDDDKLFLNGLCASPDGKFIYVTDIGRNFLIGERTNLWGMWRYNVDAKAVEVIFAPGETEYRPNGCDVDDDGLVYFIEDAMDPTNVFQYNPDTEEVVSLPNIRNKSKKIGISDGLVIDKKNGLLFTSVIGGFSTSHPGTVYVLDLEKWLERRDSARSEKAIEEANNIHWKEAVGGIIFPSDMDIDFDRERLLVPSQFGSVQNPQEPSIYVYDIVCD